MIDSEKERKIGFGTLFDYKENIHELETVVSQANMEFLGLQVGDSIGVNYDLNLLLKMYLQMSGQVLPSFVLSSVQEDGSLDLQDAEVREVMADNIVDIIVKGGGFE